MNNCKTCKFWNLSAGYPDWYDDEDGETSVDEARPRAYAQFDGDDGDLPRWKAARDRHRWGFCKRISMAVDDPDKTLAFVQDASNYRADLHTAGDFGCVHHEGGAFNE